MKELLRRFGERGRRAVALPALALLVLLLAACGGGDEPPDLVIPTLALTAGAPPIAASATPLPVASPTSLISEATTTAAATHTLPPPPTIAAPLPTSTAQPPTAAPTAGATAGATATPIVTIGPVSGPVGQVEYQVAFVAADDTLNVRRQPGPNAAVVTRLAPDATGITAIGAGQAVQGGSLWLPVETAAGDGWVNSRFLTESVGREAFCADEEVTELLNQLEAAVAGRDSELLAELVHPERGLRVRVNWWNEEIRFAGDDLERIFEARRSYNWGTEDGSGERIRGSFREIVLPRLDDDLLGASEWDCDEGRFGGTAGLTILPEGYEAVRFYSAHRPAPAEQEFDWGTWLIGVERWEGQYYLSYLVHYRWEI